MPYLGDLFYGSKACFGFNSRGTDGALATLAGAAFKVTRHALQGPASDTADADSTAGIEFTSDLDGLVGVNSVNVDMSADPDFYQDRCTYKLMLTAGTAGGTDYSHMIVGTWSLGQTKEPPIRVLTRGPGG